MFKAGSDCDRCRGGNAPALDDAGKDGQGRSGKWERGLRQTDLGRARWGCLVALDR